MPFLHPCIADILSLYLFKQRAVFLELNPNFFRGMWEGEIYKMIPAPLICLVATAVSLWIFLKSFITHTL